VKGIDRTRIPRWKSELKFKEKRSVEEFRIRRLSLVLEDIKKTGKSKQESKKERL
jgi:hypothetical protein